LHRFVMNTCFLLFICFFLACQSYTKTLEQSVERADETAAIGALRTLSAAQRTYSVSNENSFGTFEKLVNGGFLDSRFSSDHPKFRGYVLTMTVAGGKEAGSYNVNADPEPPLKGRHFYIDSTSELIHTNPDRPAGAADPSLDQ